jgi:hypothetical protein
VTAQRYRALQQAARLVWSAVLLERRVDGGLDRRVDKGGWRT